MKQRFKNIRSTKTIPSPVKHETTCSADDDIAKDNNIDSTSRTNEVFVKVTEIEGKIYTDQTGRFPVTSSRGNKYIMVAYDYDSNTIHAEAMKSRTGGELKAAYKKIQTLLASRGLKPKVHFLDNECADTFKQLMTEAGEEYQRVPPHVHRKNAAERAIQTLKNHLIAGLSSTHNDFPLHLWCRMLPHALTTLNLLRSSRINPKLSGYAQLHGAYDYNAQPLAPPGTKIIAHEKPETRKSWGCRGIDGWYIGGAPEHYRCHVIYINKTQHTRVGDTIEFFPHNFKMPFRSSSENATIAAKELVHALKHPAPAAPYSNIGDAQMEALTQLGEIFNKIIEKTHTDGGKTPHHTEKMATITTKMHLPTPQITGGRFPRVHNQKSGLHLIPLDDEPCNKLIARFPRVHK